VTDVYEFATAIFCICMYSWMNARGGGGEIRNLKARIIEKIKTGKERRKCTKH
jgi:hypothetical protein